jgi:hypothetical protein
MSNGSAVQLDNAARSNVMCSDGIQAVLCCYSTPWHTLTVCCAPVLRGCPAEAIQLLCNPPRGTQLAYADLALTPLSSKLDG